MSNAEELLNSINDGDGITTYTAEPEVEGHIVVDINRYVTVPEELKRIAVQFDHNIETVTFDCPRYWDNHDMSEMRVYIYYLRADGEPGMYRADNVAPDASDSSIMHFDWTVSKNVTMEHGKIVFLVCVKKADENGNEETHWHSELCKDCYVSEGLDHPDEELKEAYPDIIEQWYQEILNLSVLAVAPKVEVTDISGGHRVTITTKVDSTYFDVRDTIIETSDAVAELMNRFVYIGDVEPASGPILWFDTSENGE